MNRFRWFLLSSFILILGLGIVLGWHARVYYSDKQPSKLVEVRENASEYRFINPLLFVVTTREAPEYAALKRKMNTFIADAKSNGDAKSVSVYFRMLNAGKWTGINQDELYDPSSMLKVAIMLGYLKRAETDPNILLKKLSYVAADDAGQNYKPQNPLKTGSYSVQDLIQAMIVDSDNVAMALLYNNDREDFVGVLKDMRIPPPASTSELDFMSPTMYSTMFRSLYNSTYLSRNVSEQALALLSSTNFKKGLVALLPEELTVAHKFGEHTDAKNNIVISRQLHDCGIVYNPGNPYFLCIMTRGDNFVGLEKVIQGLSALVYKEETVK